MKYLVNMSNSNLIKNYGHLLSQLKGDPELQWVGKNNLRVYDLKCKTPN